MRAFLPGVHGASRDCAQIKSDGKLSINKNREVEASAFFHQLCGRAVRGAVYRASDPGVRGSREFSREGPQFSRDQFQRLCSRPAAILTGNFSYFVLESSVFEAFPCPSLLSH